MDFLSIFFVITLAALVGIFLSRPFFETTEKENAQKKIAQIESRRSALLADQERTLASIQELDFDNVLGKIAEEDFHAQRSALLKKGAGLMREIDELEQELAQIDPQTAPEPGKSVPVNDADVEAMLLARRRQRQERSGGFCPGCGHPLQKSDKFCPQCGTTL